MNADYATGLAIAFSIVWTINENSLMTTYKLIKTTNTTTITNSATMTLSPTLIKVPPFAAKPQVPNGDGK